VTNVLYVWTFDFIGVYLSMGKKDYKAEVPAGSVEEAAVAYGYLSSSLHIVEGMDLGDKHSVLEIVRKGVSYDVLLDFMKVADLHIDEMAALLHVTSRTIRRLEGTGLLNISLSEKIVMLLRLYHKGLDIFGAEEYMNTWLRSSIAGLGGESPLSLLATNIGTEIVSDELDRIAYGVYS